jgi:RNA polymerase sigma factor (sigma-70 family)
MDGGQTETLLRFVRRRAGASPGADGQTDRELLRRFAARRDEAAFRALLGRHGPMVLRVCRRRLGNAHDAEDVFQATFLVLARKAASVRWRRSVASWLYEVANRLARESWRRAGRRRAYESRVPPAPPADPLSEITGRELLALLDEELLRLPEKYRAPMVLCCLEGDSGEEAARRLGCSLSSLRRRLGRGRELLLLRLSRRGVTLSAGAFAAVLLAEGAAPAAVPAGLADSALEAVALAAAGNAASVPPEAARLAEAVVRRMSATRLRLAAALVLALGALSAGAGLIAYRADAGLPAEDPPPARPAAAASADPPKPVAAAPKPAADAGPPRDLLGDPLPPGAVARLGTSRLRGNRCIFLPDGRRLLRERSDGGLQIFEAPTGKPLAVISGTSVPDRRSIVGSTVGFTRDGKLLAAVCWGGRCGIWETATGKRVRWLESGKFYSIVHCDFSPDDKLLAVGTDPDGKGKDNAVGVYEVASGKRLFTTPGTNCAFAPDGRSLVAWNGYGGDGTARRVAVPGGEVLTTFSYMPNFFDLGGRSDGVWFFDIPPSHAVRAINVASGEVRHTFDGPGGGHEKPVYVRHVAGRRELIVVATEPPAVWCWDLETGKELWQARLPAPGHYPTLSGDGNTLVTAEDSGDVRVWDATTGKERRSFRAGTIGHSGQIAVSPDGRTVATKSAGSPANASSSVAFWDAATGQLLSDLPGHASGITAAAFAPDGATVYTAGRDRTLRAWDAATGRERSRTEAEPATELVVSPDGKTLYAAQANGGSVRVLDAGTGRAVREVAAFKKALVGMALTADGKRLVAAGRDGEPGEGFSIRVCDARTGAVLREFGGPDAVEQLAVRPDGEAVATSHVGQRVVLRDGDGKKLSEQVGRGRRATFWVKGETPYRIGSLGLSPDGRWLAFSDQEAGVVLVNARTGRETGRAKPGVYYQINPAQYEVRDVLAFAPDGKTLAWSGIESTPDVFLIEARSAGIRRRLRGDSIAVQRLAFSPDGSRLLSSGPDGAALVWDVSGRPAGAPEALPADRVAGWWDLLADDDARRAYGAMQEMAAHPAAAVALLRGKLKPVRALEPAKLATLLDRLDGPEFKDREAASVEVVALGEVTEPRLRELARSSASLEVRRRAEDALERIEAGRLRPERAVEVLETISAAGARQLLREWAGGMPGAARTADAAGALARLTRAGGGGR